MMTDAEALRLAVGVGFTLWCILWVLEVGFLLDRWMWWRRTRDAVAPVSEAEMVSRGLYDRSLGGVEFKWKRSWTDALDEDPRP